jgi:thiol-disulfide isomerase/thioredoxin
MSVARLLHPGLGKDRWRAFAAKVARLLILIVTLPTLLATSPMPVSAAEDKPLDGNNARLRFYGTELSGALFDGRTLIGKPAVLWFWTPAPYCGVCLQEAPVIAKVAAAHPEVRFIGVAGRWDVLSMRRMVSDYGLNFPNLTDANGMIWQSFFVPWPPAWAFLRPDGSGDLVNDIGSAMSEQELTDRVTALEGPRA